MKNFILSLALLSSSAFANQEICRFDSTPDFHEAMENSKVGRQVGMNADHGNFAPLENTMIYQTVTGQEWQRDLSMEQALGEFADYNEYEPGPGSMAGEILYYKIKDSRFALVHYWPGENEYGAFFELKSGSATMIAEINDGDITCK